MFKWIHFFNSKNQYKKVLNFIFENDDFILGSYVVFNGSLTFKDGRKIGNENEILAGITTATFEKDSIEKMFEANVSNISMTTLFTDLAPEEIITTKEGAIIIKKVKLFESPSEFENFLEINNYKDFKKGN